MKKKAKSNEYLNVSLTRSKAVLTSKTGKLAFYMKRFGHDVVLHELTDTRSRVWLPI